MTNAARTRRKAMLGSLLEPVTLQTPRTRPTFDHSMAKSGAVEFRDTNDHAVVNVSAEVVDGVIVVRTASHLPVRLESH